MTDQENLPLHDINVYLESIPNQIGHAILTAADGSTIRQANGSLSTKDVDIVYKIILEMGYILNIDEKVSMREELLKRITIQGGNGVYYCIGASKDGLIYIVKKSDAWGLNA